jgi:hypothetical protein
LRTFKRTIGWVSPTSKLIVAIFLLAINKKLFRNKSKMLVNFRVHASQVFSHSDCGFCNEVCV